MSRASLLRAHDHETVERTAASQPGLRERNKIEKLANIKAAARDLFMQKSFDDATTREIAERAGVAMGTIFLYADNKRDLLFLICNDEISALVEKSRTCFDPEAGVRENLMAIFRGHYRYFGDHPHLSISMLREMTFYSEGKQARQFQAITERLLAHLSLIIRHAQVKGEVRRDLEPDWVAWLAFSIYQVELRRWLSLASPQLATGLRRLRKALATLFDGAAQTNQNPNTGRNDK